MANTLGTLVTANYLKTAPTTQFGTRKLAFIVVELSGIETDYTTSDSNLSQVVRALQQQVEVYGIGTPYAGAVTVIIADDTAPYNAGDEFADAGRNARLEAALATAGITANVWNAELRGGNLNWD